MSYAGQLREMFPGLDPVVDDLYLLEWHQIAGLLERAPARELASVLHAYPGLARFFITRYPPIETALAQLLAEHGPVAADNLTESIEALLWELADWIVYQREPGRYDAEARVDWDLAAVTEVVTLEGRVVIDAGAGTGRVAFAVAPIARHVFAIEPVATLRRFMRDKATRLGIGNLFVMDGFLRAIPLPAASADVLVTCQAIGWNLPDELAEIERVVKPRGFILHLSGAPADAVAGDPLRQPLVAHGYRPETFERGGHRVLRYLKQTGGLA